MPLNSFIPLGSIDFTANGVETLELNRIGVLTEIGIRLKFTITSGTTGPVTPKWNALGRLIKRFEIDIQGQDTVVRIDGQGMIARSTLDYTVAPIGSADTVVLTGSSTATAYDLFIPLSLTLPRSVIPMHCALPLNRFTQVTASITWGDIEDIFATTNSAVVSAVTCELDGKFLLSPVDPNASYRARILDMITNEVTSTSDAHILTVDGNTGQLHRSHLLQTLVDDVANDAMLSAGSIRLKTGEFTFSKWKTPVLQAQNARVFEQSAVIAGQHYVTLEENGQPFWIDTSRQSMTADLDYEFDVTKQSGTNKIVVYSEKIRGFDLGT